MSLLIEVNCFLQSHREVPPSDHEGTWTPVPDFQYLVCLESYPLINCIHSTDFLKPAVGLLLGPWCIDFEIALWDGKYSPLLPPPPSPSCLGAGGAGGADGAGGFRQMGEVEVGSRFDGFGSRGRESQPRIKTKTPDRWGWRLSRQVWGTDFCSSTCSTASS